MSNTIYPTRDAPYVTPATLDEAKRPDPPQPKDRRTPRGHVHAEAFCLMWYACRACGAKERIWNSRDGVTPFGMSCASCGGTDMMHSNWGEDTYAPNHKLRDRQRFWRDGTPEEAAAFMRRRIQMLRNTHPLTAERESALIASARAGDQSSEFRPGWPMLDVYRDLSLLPTAATPADSITAQRDRMLAMLRKLAGECAECHGSGTKSVSYGGDGYGDRCAAQADGEAACEDCADIREAIGEAS